MWTMGTRRPTSRGGFTIVELMVVGIISMVLLMLITSAWRWFGHAATEARITIELARELKMAADSIAQDYGTALDARSADAGDSLQFDFDGGGLNGVADWASPDRIIQYKEDGGKLVRMDLSTNAQTVVAGHIQSFQIDAVAGKWQLTLQARIRGVDQNLTLQLEGT